MAPNVPTACRTPGCSGYAVERGLCADCLKNDQAPKQTASKFDQRNKWRHLYQLSRWRNRVQPAVIRRDPVCTICHHNPSEVADHIRDHRGDVQLFFDFSNLHGVCKECHDKKTGTEHGSGRSMAAPVRPTRTPEPGGVPEGVDFTKLLNIDPKKKPE